MVGDYSSESTRTMQSIRWMRDQFASCRAATSVVAVMPYTKQILRWQKFPPICRCAVLAYIDLVPQRPSQSSTASEPRHASFHAEQYGLRLSLDQLAEVLGMAKNTIYNQVSSGTFGVPTYIDCNKRFADFRDVANYLDSCRKRATTQV